MAPGMKANLILQTRPQAPAVSSPLTFAPQLLNVALQAQVHLQLAKVIQMSQQSGPGTHDKNDFQEVAISRISLRAREKTRHDVKDFSLVRSFLGSVQIWSSCHLENYKMHLSLSLL